MDFEHERHALARLVARRQHQPRANLAPVARRHVQWLDPAQRLAGQQRLIEPRHLPLAGKVHPRDLAHGLVVVGNI